MYAAESGEYQTGRLARLSRKAVAVALTAFVAAGCMKGNNTEQPTDEAVVAQETAHYWEIIRINRLTDLNLSVTEWDAPISLHAGDSEISLYQEKDAPEAELVQARIHKDIANFMLMIDRGFAREEGRSVDYSIGTVSKDQHKFFVFGGKTDFYTAISDVIGMPYQTLYVNSSQQTVRLTLFAPFPRGHFYFKSVYDDTRFDQQKAVCNSLLDVALSDSYKDRLHKAVQKSGGDVAAIDAIAQRNILDAVCGSLGMAVQYRTEGAAYAEYARMVQALFAYQQYEQNPEVFIFQQPIISEDVYNLLKV